MATIVETSKAIIDHPFFKHSLELAYNGDMSGFEKLFYELQSHVWEVNSLQASRVYGQWHRANHCDVKREIRQCPPPTNLDIRLPAVQVKRPLPCKKVEPQENKQEQLIITFTFK
jgi:hypothetical protein